MNDSLTDRDLFETRLAAAAKQFPYPPTPEPRPLLLARGVPARPRRAALAWAAVLLLVLVSAFAVPPVRAAIIEFIQIGVMRIFSEPLPTPIPAATPLPQLRDIDGETTLAEAIATAGIPVLYPAELGEPDEVYVQHIEGPIVLMVWLEGGEVEASLLALGPRAFSGKGAPESMIDTTVNGQRAAWLIGQHALYLRTTYDGFSYVAFFEAGNVLLWEAGDITYRLEGPDDMETAIRIAESMPGTP